MATLYDYHNKLLDRGEDDSALEIIIDAYCDLHRVKRNKQIEDKMAAIYKDFYKDHYFILKLIGETANMPINGDRLSHISYAGAKKLGRI